MTAETPDPLDEREQRTLDALACGLAHHDPDFAARMEGARAARERRRPGSPAGAARGALRVAGLVVLSVLVSVVALVLGPGAVVVLVLMVTVGAIAVAAVRQHGRAPGS